MDTQRETLQNNRYILVVDDSPEDSALLCEGLESDYQIQSVLCAEDALDYLNQGKPIELMLLDVNLPGMDGYQACRNIRANEEFNDIDIIFVSSNDDTEEIIQGLELGAIDYITKPYDIDILRSKIDIAFKNRDRRDLLSDTIKEANKVAMNAISDTGDLGVVVSFLRESFNVSSYENLADTIVQSLEQLGLRGRTYLHVEPEGRAYLNRDHNSTELEIELMRRLIGRKSTFLSKDERLFIGQRDIVVFISNMPNDAEKGGRLKDYLMILLEGANEKLRNLNHAQQLESMRKVSVGHIVDNAKQALTRVQQLQLQCHNESLEALQKMVDDVQESMLTMGLTEAQEHEIIDLLNQAHDSVLDNLVKGVDVNNEVAAIIDLLNVAG